jgi:type IV pilus assembly protein PilY1
MIKEVIPMKSIKSVLLLVTFLLLAFAIHSYARDTDLYTAGDALIEPNILIIFDNSGSMDGSIDTGNHYDPSVTYPSDPNHPDINKDVIYEQKSGDWFPLKPFTISSVDDPKLCSKAKKALTGYDNGIYSNGNTICVPPATNCTKTKATITTGNWLNFYLASDSVIGSMRKIDIAKKVITNFLESVDGVRVGMMVFNSQTKTTEHPFDNGGQIQSEIKTLDDSARTKLIEDVNLIQPESYTPLAGALYEASLYFKGAKSYFNRTKSGGDLQYTSPIYPYCQKSYVIIMTDGQPWNDNNSILTTAVGDRGGDDFEPPPKGPSGTHYPPGWVWPHNGSDFLDDVARYLYDTDLVSDSVLQDKQNVITYTIGFDMDNANNDSEQAKDLLQRTATEGHGKFFTTKNSATMAHAFANVINEILSKGSSFVAPIVPVSRMEKTTAGDKIYLAFFKPNQGVMWSGNIKKYGVAQSNDPSKGIVVGDILDVSGSKALDSYGAFYATTKSYWTESSQDGGDVEKGGVGELLMKRDFASNPRKIYTWVKTDKLLTDKENAFKKDNDKITKDILGVSTDDEKKKLIDFVHGYDAYDDDGNGRDADDGEKRNWILGSFLHSRPYVLNYADRTVIYAGANDGMLHAFLDTENGVDKGEELWAFIPPDLLGRLKELHTDNPDIFVDGSPKAYVSYAADGKTVNQAILIFGLRRGGNYYYALDVTSPTAPKYLWKIYKGRKQGTVAYYQDLAQTWSTPVIGKVAYGTGETWVAIFGGGYDTNEDSSDSSSEGRGIYMADVQTGDCVWYHSYPGGDTNMNRCIPSDVTAIDLDGDERIDRLYVGDTGGRMWRFDIGDLNKNGNSDPNEWTAKKIFNCNPGGSEKRKLFYPPDVTLEKDSTGEYEMLFFGTGDREHPKDPKSDKDILFAFKDKNVLKSATDLIDVTEFYSLSSSQQTAKINEIKAGYGWYIKLDKKDGEKCLSTPLVYYKIAYYTTFSPAKEAIAGDLCFVGEGTATLYALNYGTGEAAFNFDLTNDVGETIIKGKSDRSLIIGTAIPSGVVITVIGGKVTAYVGVGGGVYKPQLSSTKSLFPLNWKLVF